jgi:hypothetical protein
MSNMRRRVRELAIAGVALIALVSGCATNIEGSEKPPFDWIADSPSNQCVAISGNYTASGMPAPANALAGSYGAVWPAEGSLLSIVERGTNAPPRKSPRLNSKQDPANIVTAVSILVDESGRIVFEAKNAKGENEKLRPQAWTCKSGALTSLVALNTEDFESYVQLWKSGNDLIAEQTIRATDAHPTRAEKHQPVARFYFRFSSTID